jgi:hypothetical protein
MLRINGDGTIPPDNPFFNQAVGNNRAIWTLGLRNPFTFNFQPGSTRMFINDVGQNTWEEINDGLAGVNYGWPTCEGACGVQGFTNPIYQYQNDASTCAITGGTFYNPATQMFPAQYVGKYFFADYCAGWIRLLDPANNTASGFATGLSLPVDLQVGPDGALYYLQRGNGGQVWRVAFGSNAPMITQHPANLTVNVGEPASFTVAASGATPLGYQWQRNNMDIAGATASSYTLNPATLADNGAQFRCVVSNGFGTATSNAATLTVVNNLAPTATITQPTAGALYSGGQLIAFAGTGADPEDGALPPSAFTWEIVFHHDTHTHPFIPPFSGQTSGTFTIPAAGETAVNVWYRIHLTVTDSGGRTHAVFRDVNPRVVTLTLQSNPAGLQLTLDGQPVTAPFATLCVAGIERQLGVVSPQTVNNTVYLFQSWSDGGAATHTIATPASDTTYTASFAERGNLQFFPLPRPVRLLDTRAGFAACYTPGAPIAGGTSRTQAARGVCAGLTIPNTALAITGNITTVQSGGGYLTLYPSDAAQPTVASSNYLANEIVNNVFTVGLGLDDGAFKIFVTSNTDVVVDVTGYYAPPSSGGLYFHPLPTPIRLLDTRPGFAGCFAPGAPVQAGAELAQQARLTCNGVTIPANAQAIAGNATIVQPGAGGFLTLWPSGNARPVVASSNFLAGQIVNAPFTVGLGANGEFMLFSTATSHIVVDVLGYFSADAVDVNGAGLRFTPLARPVRLLETRAGFSGCYTTNAPLAGGSVRAQAARGVCDGLTIANTALAVVGNATVANTAGGYLTFWPSNAAQPTVATSNYEAGQIWNRHFMVGLGPTGAFNIFPLLTTDLIIDVSGYFAP